MMRVALLCAGGRECLRLQIGSQVGLAKLVNQWQVLLTESGCTKRK